MHTKGHANAWVQLCSERCSESSGNVHQQHGMIVGVGRG